MTEPQLALAERQLREATIYPALAAWAQRHGAALLAEVQARGVRR